MCKGYQYNRFWSRFFYYGKIKAALPAELHEPLWDSFDQDHAMIIAEGTKAGIFQSIMMKPPNLQPVYPLRHEREDLKTHIKFDASKSSGPVVIFNTETMDPKSMLYTFYNQDHLTKFLNQLNGLNSGRKGNHYDIVVLHHPQTTTLFTNKLKNFDHFTAVSTEDPFNIDFDQATKDQISSQGRKVLWMSQCTQFNIITALETFRAPMVGFANEGKSMTQMFNCHKLNKFNVGRPISIEYLDNYDPTDKLVSQTIDQIMDDYTNVHHNVTFYSLLLSDDERLSRMDLQYWVDYVYLFGVKELIPLYDHMNPIVYRNWDVYILLWSIFFFILYIDYKLLKCCCSLCSKKNKVKSD